MLQTNQDKKANDTNLHVWPVKTDKQAVKAYWQFVSRLTSVWRQLISLGLATSRVNSRQVYAQVFTDRRG